MAKMVDRERVQRPSLPLRLNLYGHPLAGLYWERHCKKALYKCGFKPVRGWECLYKNESKQQNNVAVQEADGCFSLLD